jgi:hypothetical protein
VGYRYDLDGNRRRVIYPDATTVNDSFDKASRLTSLLDWTNRSTTYAYFRRTDLPASGEPPLTCPDSPGETSEWLLGPAQATHPGAFARGRAGHIALAVCLPPGLLAAMTAHFAEEVATV